MGSDLLKAIEGTTLYFDDLSVGDQFKTVARTIAEADIVNFAGLSGDFNALHTDAEFAATTPHGQRIAHGLLVLAIASRLATRLSAAPSPAQPRSLRPQRRETSLWRPSRGRIKR